MNRFKKTVLVTVLVGLVAGVALPARGELKLKSIMTDLSHHMEAVVAAISTEDFKEIELHAIAIADHEKPPMPERVKILGLLKSNAGHFKGTDHKVHESASIMAEAARNEEMEGVLTSFRDVLTSCVECHTGYRAEIVGHFYNEDE